MEWWLIFWLDTLHIDSKGNLWQPQLNLGCRLLPQTDKTTCHPWINYLLKEECNIMLFSKKKKKITLFLLQFRGSLSCIHWLVTCGSLQTQLRHLLPQALPCLSFKQSNFSHKRQEAPLKPINCLEREDETEAFKANGWEIKVGRGEGFPVLKATATQSTVTSHLYSLCIKQVSIQKSAPRFFSLWQWKIISKE